MPASVMNPTIDRMASVITLPISKRYAAHDDKSVISARMPRISDRIAAISEVENILKNNKSTTVERALCDGA
jgi:hypothetical protein